MYKVFIDVLLDTTKMIPLLLLIYVGIEFIEFKFGRAIREKVKSAGKAGPLLGAGFGVVPQCGFSVISTALYTQRLISIGTLLAVYISTSDEAVPVILAQPHKAGIILPLLAVKIVVAVAAGYSIDLFFRRSAGPVTETEVCAASAEHSTGMPHEHHLDEEQLLVLEEGCCGHHLDKPNYREMLVHPIVHTLKVFIFIFVASLTLNFIMLRAGANITTILLGQTIFQPVIVGLIGLIPNCAASVAITEIFLKGGISFGSAIAGLSASAGLGMLVLLKENRNIKDTLKVIGLLYGISVVSGIVIQYLYK